MARLKRNPADTAVTLPRPTTWNRRRVGDGGVIGPVAECPVVVVAPGLHRAVGAQREHVKVTGGELSDPAARALCLDGHDRVGGATVAELTSAG